MTAAPALRAGGRARSRPCVLRLIVPPGNADRRHRPPVMAAHNMETGRGNLARMRRIDYHVRFPD